MFAIEIPQYLDEVGWTTGPNRMVGCTQPRRVAATSVCQRVRSEMLASAPGTVAAVVGYSVRFDDDWTPGVTRLKFLTDGMLLREMMMDPLLSSYSVIMIDEAHERSVASDLLVALVKKLLQKRKDLRLIISSASVDALAFKEYYKGVAEGGVGILSVEGRMFPVGTCFGCDHNHSNLKVRNLILGRALSRLRPRCFRDGRVDKYDGSIAWRYSGFPHRSG